MKSKKLISALLSMTMIAGMAAPAFADNETAGGTANILDYATTTVVAPTTMKFALNPNNYTVTTKYVKTTDATYQSSKTYYTYADNKFTKATITAFADNTDYYEAVTSTDQVISLNYGIVNKSTEAKRVSVSLAVTYTAADNKEAIEFVDTEAKAMPYVAGTGEGSNADGAKKDELKMYLAVASSTAAPTTDKHYVLTKDTALGQGKTYYTSAGVAIENASVDNIATYYEETTAIDTTTQDSALADVTMTKATVGNVVFAKGTGSTKAEAKVGYKLDAATYTVKAGEIIDFSTTQAQLANKLEMSAIGGTAAFTITGKINANADWTKAEASEIKITPTYDWTVEADGTEEAIAVSGVYNQIKTSPDVYTVTYNANYGETPATETESVTKGEKATGKKDGDNIAFTREGYTFAGWMTTANGTETVTVTDQTITANITFYAKWTQAPADVDPAITEVGTFTKASPADVVIKFTLGSGEKAVTADSAVLYQGSSKTVVNTAKYSVNMNEGTITVDKSAGFMTGATADVPITVELKNGDNVVKTLTSTITIS